MLVPTYEIKIEYTCDSCGEEVVFETVVRQGGTVKTVCQNCRKEKTATLPQHLFVNGT